MTPFYLWSAYAALGVRDDDGGRKGGNSKPKGAPTPQRPKGSPKPPPKPKGK